MRLLYSVLLYLLTPFALLRVYLRGIKEPVYSQHIGERFGIYPCLPAGSVVVHVVSLGETRAAQPLIRALMDAGHHVLLTHTTATGREQGHSLFLTDIQNGRLTQCWLPYDLDHAVLSFYRAVRPRAVLLVETEVWPNLVYYARRLHIPISLVSARLSERSLTRLLKVSRFSRQTYSQLTIILAQTQADADRFRRITDVPIQVVGNLKFDMSVSRDIINSGLIWNVSIARPVIVIASTRESEEVEFIEAIKYQVAKQNGTPPPLYLIVPRHPQRFSEIARLLSESGLPSQKRSDMLKPSVHQGTVVVLGDSIGEMPLYYSMSDLAIIGGSFAPLGGQNLIEAAVCGLPIIVGPHMFNFQQATEDAIRMGGCYQVMSPLQAIELANEWLSKPQLIDEVACQSRAFAKQYTGATAIVMATLKDYLSNN